jgi:hypothetical protein
VDRVQRGLVRVPAFQRPLRWDAADVLNLFDSISRGFPIGSLLLRQGNAPAARVKVGPLMLDATESSSAWWVVDGQQRLTALAAGLGRPLPIPTAPDDVWVVYFSPRTKTFEAPPKHGTVPTEWIPAPVLLDSAALSEWVFQWPHKDDEKLRGRLFEAGKSLREYRVPLYVIDTDDEELLKEIFVRINKTGKRLDWNEVHDALFGGTDDSPSTLDELADHLAALGMGRPSYQGLLQPCVVAVRGLDPTQTFGELRNSLDGAVKEALPALRRVLSFLRTSAAIPHLRLLPLAAPLAPLARFFAIHPEPSARSRELLVRWLWRVLMGPRRYDERTLQRRGVRAVGDDEEESVQQLLTLAATDCSGSFALPAAFDARAAESRLALLGLASISPRDLMTGVPIDVSALIEAADVDAFRRILSSTGGLARSPANRMIHPGSGSARADIEACIQRDGVDSDVLRSHAISPVAAQALQGRDIERFLDERRASVEQAVDHLAEQLCAWDRSDRPSIEHLLGQAAGD